MKKTIIIGNGVAGVNAAKAIRERDSAMEIVMYGDEPTLPYYRPMLTKTLLMGKQVENMFIKQKKWFDEQRIDIRVNQKVDRIDTQNKQIMLSDGSKDAYDALIIATGASSFIPPIPGADRGNVFAIRRYKDLKNIEAAAHDINHVVVIGGGVLGLEAAWQFKKKGIQVTVLELAPKLMIRQLDNKASDLMFKTIRSMGMDAFVGISIDEITGNEMVSGVRLKDGTVIRADMVIVSTGIRAEVDLAKAAGVEVDRAIVVNDRCETNIPDVYAAGDCAQFEGINYGIMAQAQRMGTVAGANITGEDMRYEQVEAAILFHGMETQLYALGDVGKDLQKSYSTVEHEDVEKGVYTCYYFVDNVFSGAVLYGDTKDMKRVSQAYKNKSTRQEMFG